LSISQSAESSGNGLEFCAFPCIST
jgi:hypothetical protein